MSKKYPRTPHFPWSPGGTKDDRHLTSIEGFIGIDLVITEKMDGSNVCFTKDYMYARSHGGTPKHKSFDLAKSLHSTIRHIISPDISIFGEWCYAVHSIQYTLPNYFLMFGIRNDKTQQWFSWSDVEEYSKNLNLLTVPVLWKGTVNSKQELIDITTTLSNDKSKYGNEREGIVVRPADAFSNDSFKHLVAKIVRKNHVSTTEHWKFKKIEKQNMVKRT